MIFKNIRQFFCRKVFAIIEEKNFDRKKYATLLPKDVEVKHMKQIEQIKKYLEYCEFRKELDKKTIKAYRIDLKNSFSKSIL